jgi:hypothetical protein
MSVSPRLSLSYIVSGQAQKEVTHNDALNDLDSLAQISVINMTTSTPPASPSDGDCYIIATGASGAWSGSVGKIASYYSGWRIKTPQEGWMAWVRDIDRAYMFDGTNWVLTNLAIPTSGYLNFGTTFGTSGYGLRDNAGSLEYKNSGGAWAALTSGGGGGGGTSFSAGSASAPGWPVTTDTDTGLFQPSSTPNTLSIASGGVESARFKSSPSAVNYVQFTPSATTAAVTVGSAGSDTNIDVALTPKGTGVVTVTNGVLNLGIAGTALGKGVFAGNTSGTTTLQPAAAASGTLTLPAATDTLVGKATTDTLTNKTFDTAGTGNAFKLNGSTLTTVPQFQSALMIQPPPQGRLTLSSGNAVMNADATAQSTVYYAPHLGAYVPVYDGTQVALKSILSSNTDAVGLSLALDPTSGHTNYHQTGKLFDLFVINDSGTMRLATGPAWSSSTARGTGAGTTELQRFMGFWTNKNSMTARFGSASGNTVSVAANQATYVGTLYATTDGQTGMAFKPSAAAGGTNNFLGLYNAYNRVMVNAENLDSTVSYTGYTSSTVRAANASNSNRISFIDGLQQSSIGARYFISVNSSGYNPIQSGVGLDTTTVFSGAASYYQVALTQTVTAADIFTPQLGLHYVQALETGQSGVTWFCGSNMEALQITLEM